MKLLITQFSSHCYYVIPLWSVYSQHSVLRYLQSVFLNVRDQVSCPYVSHSYKKIYLLRNKILPSMWNECSHNSLWYTVTPLNSIRRLCACFPHRDSVLPVSHALKCFAAISLVNVELKTDVSEVPSCLDTETDSEALELNLPLTQLLSRDRRCNFLSRL
jgi:hypothetical protein